MNQYLGVKLICNYLLKCHKYLLDNYILLVDGIGKITSIEIDLEKLTIINVFKTASFSDIFAFSKNYISSSVLSMIFKIDFKVTFLNDKIFVHIQC